MRLEIVEAPNAGSYILKIYDFNQVLFWEVGHMKTMTQALHVAEELFK
jgi:hypothetical protein